MSIANFLAGLRNPQAPSAASASSTASGPAAPAPSPASADGAQSSVPVPPEAGAAPNPLDAWAKMFEAPEAAISPAAPAAPDLWAPNSEHLARAAGNINLSSILPPELVGKALGGDQGAFVEIINKSTQMAFMMAYQASMQGVKPAVEARFADFSKEMPSTFKKLSVDATLQGDPLLSNPAMKPVVDGLRSQILAKHPDASPQQLQQAISEYLKALGISITPPAPGQERNASHGPSKTVDWDNFLS